MCPYLHRLTDWEEFSQTSQFLSQYEAPSGETGKQYFECVGPERLALSRHLTMIADLNSSFVADKRLWKSMALYPNERELYMFPAQKSRKLGEKRKFSDLS